jgi:small subunit ribosomal protein S20
LTLPSQKPTTTCMANTKSAQKRTRQTIRKTARNKGVLTAVRSAIKAAKSTKSSKASGTDTLKVAVSKIMKAASKGVLHKRTAARYVSRLTRASAK